MSDKTNSDAKDVPISLLPDMRADPGMAPRLGVKRAPRLASGILMLEPELVPAAIGGDAHAQGFRHMPGSPGKDHLADLIQINDAHAMLETLVVQYQAATGQA